MTNLKNAGKYQIVKKAMEKNQVPVKVKLTTCDEIHILTGRDAPDKLYDLIDDVLEGVNIPWREPIEVSADSTHKAVEQSTLYGFQRYWD